MTVDTKKFRRAVHETKKAHEAIATADARLVIGQRLAIEAARLRLNDSKAAKHAACSTRTWAHYTAGITTPDAPTLLRLDAVGFDVLYVVTGRVGRRRKMAERQGCITR